MGRPKKVAAGRKPLAKKDMNVLAQPEVKLEGESAGAGVAEVSNEDQEEQVRIVNLVCNAVDQEVEARSAAMRAIRDGHISSVTTQLQLLLSKYPMHIRKMPMPKFLKEYCPNTKATTRPDGTIQLDIIQDPASTLDPSGEFESVKEQLGLGVSKQLAGQKREKEQLSWDEFLAAYRMQSATKGSTWETPSLRTPGMSWRDTMMTRNMTPMTEKVFPIWQPSQTGTTQVGGTKRKVPTSRGLRM